jgi:hypothetical protein
MTIFQMNSIVYDLKVITKVNRYELVKQYTWLIPKCHTAVAFSWTNSG